MLVRPFIDAMERQVNEGKAITYGPMLELCRWVASRPREEDTLGFDTDEGEMVDRDWQWCRDAVVGFIERACDKGIDQAYRETLWQVLEPFMHDPDRYCHIDKSDEDMRLKDFSTDSLNNPRGRAIHAVFRYARWVANKAKIKQGGNEIVPNGLGSMEEVRKALEAGLESGEHDTCTVRAAYGMHTHLLYWIDKQWLRSWVDRIFNLARIEEPTHAAYGWAAWNSFLLFVPPHVEFFRLLQKQFIYTVEQYRLLEAADVDPSTPPASLAKHLVLLYGRGQLGLDDHDGLLRRFLTQSPQSVRSYAVSFVGESLCAEEESPEPLLPPAVVDRFVKLWEWYWPEVGVKDANPSRNLFGCWYLSRCFEREWALRQLAAYTEKVGLPEPDYQLDEKLAADAELDPATALLIMTRLIAADAEGWRIDSWQESTRKILACALKADQATRTLAMALINRLARRGFVGFGDLLR